MTAIYLELSALRLPSPDPAVPEEQLAPGAVDAIGHLADAGFDVVVLVPDDEPAPPLDVRVKRSALLPEHLDAGAWYITGEPVLAFDQPTGGKTALVGPRQPVGKVPLPRFDLEARDIGAVAMEILTRDAMS